MKYNLPKNKHQSKAVRRKIRNKKKENKLFRRDFCLDKGAIHKKQINDYYLKEEQKEINYCDESYDKPSQIIEDTLLHDTGDYYFVNIGEELANKLCLDLILKDYEIVNIK